MPTYPPVGVEPAPTPAVTSTVADRRTPALRRFAVSITVLTVAGHWFLGFEQAPIVPLVVVGYAYLLDLAFEWSTSWAQRRRPGFAGGWRRLVDQLLPTHISALACAMLLYANSSPWPYLFAITAAVSSRYLIRIRIDGRHRHVLNPSNAGITLTLLLFSWVSIAPPYQFTADIGGALDWLVPAALRAAELLFVVAAGVVAGVPAAVTYGLLLILALHHYDLTARLEKRLDGPPLRRWSLGWDGRVLLLAAAAAGPMLLAPGLPATVDPVAVTTGVVAAFAGYLMLHFLVTAVVDHRPPAPDRAAHHRPPGAVARIPAPRRSPAIPADPAPSLHPAGRPAGTIAGDDR